ncbi:MAG TPA: proteasome subunit beta [Nitrospiria bacterium]|nr:proteasome subunit beta [Nitrospiria bacterium]
MSLELDQQGSSFFQFLSRNYPQLLSRSEAFPEHGGGPSPTFPHGTTILALKCERGVVIAGDRRATEGHQIADRTMKKIFKTDESSAVGISGAAGPCMELVKLFKTEIEHYEKLEGAALSLEGKANKLGEMVRANLAMAFQGLVVIPIFAGYDYKKDEGRIFKYDITGGRYEEAEYYSTGSGGKDAKNTIKKLYRKGLPEEEAMKIAVEALYDAAEEDSATGGPDLIRGIFPIVTLIRKNEMVEVTDDRVRGMAESIVESKRER